MRAGQVKEGQVRAGQVKEGQVRAGQVRESRMKEDVHPYIHVYVYTKQYYA